MNNNSGISQTEKRIGFVALVICLGLAYLLSPWGADLLSDGNPFDRREEIGQITFRKNDTRHRSKNVLSWEKAKEKQPIRIGDSVFSGQNSSAKVTMNDSTQVTIGENSLVVFSSVDSEKLADLQFGNFKIKVDGEMKVAIQGVVTEVKGESGSELQVFMNKEKKPVFKIVKGVVAVKKKKQDKIVFDSRKMETSEPIEFFEPIEAAVAIAAEKPQTEVIPEKPQLDLTKPPLISSLDKNTVRYIWKLYDLYEQKDQQLEEKKSPPQKVSATYKVSWLPDENPLTYIELSNDENFKNNFSDQSTVASFDFNQLSVGENFWHLSHDQKNWSPTEKFSVETDFLTNAEPTAESPTAPIPLITQATKVQLNLKTSLQNPLGFIVQASLNSDFSSENIRTFWSSQSLLNLTFFKPGEYYYRFKTVAGNQELSTWSKTIHFSIFAPAPPAPPILANAKKEGYVEDLFNMSWKSEGVKTRVELTDQKNQLVQDFIGTENKWRPLVPGEYSARAWTVNSYGQESLASKTLKLKVLAKPMLAKILEKPPEVKKETPRQVAAVESTNTIVIEKNNSNFMNDKYKTSSVSVNGFFWEFYSSEQYYSGEIRPLSTGVGLHGMYWNGSDGLEGNFKSGAVGLNDTGKTYGSIKDVEARYHHRFFTGFPFSLSRELQVSFFGGYEVYGNTGGSFVDHYNLFKFGTTLDFPIANRWIAGTELTLGYGLDRSQKKEFSVNGSYLFKTNWSFGAGYRINIFDAGSESSSPQNRFPYSEGYTEGYSELNYHF